MRSSIALCAGALLCSSALAWAPAGDCPVSAEQRMESNRIALEPDRNEIPLPFPYPRTEQEIVENLRGQLLKIWSTEPKKMLQPAVAAALEALEGSSLSFETHRVENWTPTRCSPGGDYLTFTLVVGRSREGVELLRAALGRDGQLATWAHTDSIGGEAGFPPVPQVADSSREIAKRTGAMPRDGQLVALDGVNLRCPILSPCAAARLDDQPLILDRSGKLFVIDTRARPLNLAEVGQSGEIDEHQAEVKRGEVALVTGGLEELLIARPWKEER